ncbi:MAG: hypothetical protein D6722_25815 [Bacteroidetes bacterium]|nr:MAG: hypothetical protein D6722_25815 [Bacteroidota bacterium]
MLPPELQRQYTIEASQVSPQGWLHLHETNRLLQEIAGAHADSWGLGYEGMQARGLVWVLNRLHLRWRQLPRWRHGLTIDTWVGEMKGPVSDRYFRLGTHREAGLGAVATRWVALDQASGRPARVQFTHVPVLPGTPDPALSLDSLPRVEGFAHAATFALRYSDLDPLGHANNSAYLRWVVDSYATGFLTRHQPLELKVHYLAEVQAGQSIEVWTLPESAFAFQHDLRVEGQTVCRLFLRWSPDNP